MAATNLALVEAAAQKFRNDYVKTKEQIGKAVVGHDEIVDGVLTCLFAGGHALLEGVPGLGRTGTVLIDVIRSLFVSPP
jgi:MoxR-like ATPase